MASFQKTILVLIAFFTTFISSTHARTFQVGGKDGWTLHPSENYNSWSGRLRFLINDTLHFKYDGGTDSVLVVNKGDYDGCNVNNPIMKMEGGDSMFKFDRSGPFYFITGNKSNCDQGQKMTVVVLALRNRTPPPSAATPPSSSTPSPSPAVSPVSPPSESPVSPPSGSPEPSTSGAPTMAPPASSPSPGGGSAVSPVSPPSESPVSPPSGSPEPSSSGAPTMAPPASSPFPGGGSADSPGGGSADSPGGGSGATPGGGGGGGGQPPEANSPSGNADTPASSGVAQPFSGSVMVSLVTMMFALWGVN